MDKPYINSTKCGKSYIQEMEIQAAVEQGKRVAIIGLDGSVKIRSKAEFGVVE